MHKGSDISIAFANSKRRMVCASPAKLRSFLEMVRAIAQVMGIANAMINAVTSSDVERSCIAAANSSRSGMAITR